MEERRERVIEKGREGEREIEGERRKEGGGRGREFYQECLQIQTFTSFILSKRLDGMREKRKKRKNTKEKKYISAHEIPRKKKNFEKASHFWVINVSSYVEMKK